MDAATIRGKREAERAESENISSLTTRIRLTNDDRRAAYLLCVMPLPSGDTRRAVVVRNDALLPKFGGIFAPTLRPGEFVRVFPSPIIGAPRRHSANRTVLGIIALRSVAPRRLSAILFFFPHPRRRALLRRVRSYSKHWFVASLEKSSHDRDQPRSFAFFIGCVRGASYWPSDWRDTRES